MCVFQIENQRIIVWQVGDHVSFVPETGALMLRSVTFTDSGDYLCVVNNKRDNGMARLFVQGEFNRIGPPLPPAAPQSQLMHCITILFIQTSQHVNTNCFIFLEKKVNEHFLFGKQFHFKC